MAQKGAFCVKMLCCCSGLSKPYMVHAGAQEEAEHSVAITGTSRPAYVHRVVPHGYDYEGNVTFTNKLTSGPIPVWSAAHGHSGNASARPASHRTVLVTRDGRRFTKT